MSVKTVGVFSHQHMFQIIVHMASIVTCELKFKNMSHVWIYGFCDGGLSKTLKKIVCMSVFSVEMTLQTLPPPLPPFLASGGLDLVLGGLLLRWASCLSFSLGLGGGVSLNVFTQSLLPC